MKVIDNLELTGVDQVGKYERALRQNQVIVTVDYAKDTESSMELSIDASNLDDTQGAESWAPLSEKVSDGGNPPKTSITPIIYTFSESGRYRFLVNKSVREDALRFRVKAIGGTTLGSVTVFADIENVSGL